eukprot:467340-Prymnesium_polylepis.1
MSRHVAVVSRRCRDGVATCRDVSRTCRAQSCRAHVAHMSRTCRPCRAASRRVVRPHPTGPLAARANCPAATRVWSEYGGVVITV